MIRQLFMISSVRCGDHTCVGRDEKFQWVLCRNYCNMGRAQGRCKKFGVLLDVRTFKKGIPIARRAPICKGAECYYKNFIQTYEIVNNKE